ncbi:hypothetical protein RUM43_001418 [Polyplax serrata]|uniref:RHD domain-containing protein n=1 Tax=Polyplax serrata TaxID=468196 RepID=A0AAN8SHR0_POLSC
MMLPINNSDCNEAHLMLTVPPETRFRYRYDTEMSGTHGSLQGIQTGRDKSVPTVKLLNFPHEALIRVTLATCPENGEHHPHPHSLFVKEKLYNKHIYENLDNKTLTKTGHYPGPHYISIGGSKKDYTARFEGMCIINSKRENFHTSIREKLKRRYLEQEHDTFRNLTSRMVWKFKLSNLIVSLMDYLNASNTCWLTVVLA